MQTSTAPWYMAPIEDVGVMTNLERGWTECPACQSLAPVLDEPAFDEYHVQCLNIECQLTDMMVVVA